MTRQGKSLGCVRRTLGGLLYTGEIGCKKICIQVLPVVHPRPSFGCSRYREDLRDRIEKLPALDNSLETIQVPFRLGPARVYTKYFLAVRGAVDREIRHLIFFSWHRGG